VAQTLAPTDTIDLAEAERDLAALLDRVARAGSRVVLTRDGRPLGALVPVDDLDRLQQLDAKREKDFAVLDRIGAAFADVDPEEIERETAKALAEVRAEMRAERAAARSAER
jgi:prevent-host-death family protein